jgi:carbonic anhydrase
MRLFEGIVDANQRATGGDAKAGLHPAEFADSLPIIALTCIDPRLNPLMPEVLGIPEQSFIWLRNAGNIITGPMSSMMRSLSLACAVKGGKEIAIIGHTDCLVGKTSALQLTDRFSALGIPRSKLPDNLQEFFGMFASERQNVMRGVDFARQSPVIGPKIPVHGLMVDIQTGRLEWVVNGYQALETVGAQAQQSFAESLKPIKGFENIGEFKIGEMKFPEQRIGEAVSTPGEAQSLKVATTPAVTDWQPSAVPVHEQDAEQEATRFDPAAIFKVVGEDRKIYGPVSAKQLEQWLDEGRVALTALAQKVGYKEWKQLSAFLQSHRPGIPLPPELPRLKTRSDRRERPAK